MSGGRATAMARGLGFADADLDRQLGRFRAGSSPGPRSRGLSPPARSAAAGRAHEPPRHRLARVARADAPGAGRGGGVGRSRPLVPGVGRYLGARARGRPLALLRGHLAPLAARQAERELALGKAFERQQAELARLQRFVDRFRYGTKARQAQCAEDAREIERIERAVRRAAAGLPVPAAPAAHRTGRVRAGRASIDVGEPPVTLIESAELWLERGEHVSLVGPNGSGKTTLIETLAGHRPLAAGKLRIGHNVQVGYLSQHADELGAGGTPGACSRPPSAPPA